MFANTILDITNFKSVINNLLSLMFFLHVSTSTKSSLGRCIQRKTSVEIGKEV